uniref:Uncharacterized protein n=1 Tax=Mycena chlorophos TaxID=658473 RepID=A0ABQ0M5V6_MYCCL|nr:predicted protein [Mycena chlorophos]
MQSVSSLFRSPIYLKRSGARSSTNPSRKLLSCSKDQSITLLQKMSERLACAYQSFSLAIQTGAFAQLLLTLSAVASRMNKLILEITETLVQAVATIQSISTALDLPHVEAPPEREPLGSDTPRAVPEPTTRLGRAEMHDDAPRNEHGTPTNRLSPRSMAVSVQQRVVKRVKPALPDKRPHKKHKGPRDEIDDIFGDHVAGPICTARPTQDLYSN